MQKFLTPQDVQKILRVSKPTVYRIIDSADFPKIRFGQVIRIPPDAFQKWVEQKTGGIENEDNHN